MATLAALVVPMVLAAQERVPAEPMSYLGAAWLERAERELEELPDEVLDAMELRPGDVVADLGAGSGYFARRMARRVTPGGRVLAVDIQPEMLDILQRLSREEGVEGVEAVLATETDPRLPAGQLDWVVIADVYHEMAEPTPVLARLRESLAPGGRVALLEYRGEDGRGDHIKADHRMTVRQVLTEWGAAGFVLADLLHFLPSQHLFVFTAAGDGLGSGDLFDAVESGLVQADARFHGDEVRLRLRSREDRRVVLHAAAGALFTADKDRIDLVSRRDLVADLPAGGEVEIGVRVVPRHFEGRLPGRGAGVTPRRAPAATAAVMAAAQAGMYEVAPGDRRYVPQYDEIERAALWLTEPGASWGKLQGHLGSERVPPAWAAAFGLALVDAAGIDVSTLDAWERRGDIFSLVPDDGLSRWLQTMLRR